MTGEIVEDPHTFFHELGELHDVRILRLSYLVQESRLEVQVEDLNWNFEGYPEYVARPAVLEFSTVSALAIVVGQDRFHTTLVNEGATISSAYAITKDGVTRADFHFSTGEYWHVEFVTLTVLDTP